MIDLLQTDMAENGEGDGLPGASAELEKILKEIPEEARLRNNMFELLAGLLEAEGIRDLRGASEAATPAMEAQAHTEAQNAVKGIDPAEFPLPSLEAESDEQFTHFILNKINKIPRGNRDSGSFSAVGLAM